MSTHGWSLAHRAGATAGHLVRRRWRTLTSRDQHYSISGVEVVLPPEHNLPFFQRMFPHYDRYAERLLRDLAAGADDLLLIDIGANVGDTAVLALESAPNVRVVAVEGSSHFLPFLRANTVTYGERVQVIQGFVGPVEQLDTYSARGGTGSFGGAGSIGIQRVSDWVAPEDLLRSSAGVTVWKSDTDGMDIHILARHFPRIAETCAVLWFEFDPRTTLGDRGDVARLVSFLDSSGRAVSIFDNMGRHMCTVPSGGVGSVLGGLGRWLLETSDDPLSVDYFDLWVWDTDRVTVPDGLG